MIICGRYWHASCLYPCTHVALDPGIEKIKVGVKIFVGIDRVLNVDDMENLKRQNGE